VRKSNPKWSQLGRFGFWNSMIIVTIINCINKKLEKCLKYYRFYCVIFTIWHDIYYVRHVSHINLTTPSLSRQLRYPTASRTDRSSWLLGWLNHPRWLIGGGGLCRPPLWAVAYGRPPKWLARVVATTLIVSGVVW
jgi:hypothetical protein